MFVYLFVICLLVLYSNMVHFRFPIEHQSLPTPLTLSSSTLAQRFSPLLFIYNWITQSSQHLLQYSLLLIPILILFISTVSSYPDYCRNPSSTISASSSLVQHFPFKFCFFLSSTFYSFLTFLKKDILILNFFLAILVLQTHFSLAYIVAGCTAPSSNLHNTQVLMPLHILNKPIINH